ncbi:CocE/NonD family hydrolase [Granulosicoccus antarcticus]|uniref:Cocaine esterase n=1 Tax=Granulosicoccus antarcticus IMCC3135 TaxID=1192854 RepID=A0A2Z2NUQ8_9GAMM|nr:CocE/NonD family hydrolase [Granulosicoccus antarcticus]ASJ74235.1 Cocaine esterase [Granulosicoccus antarcticus IMCC3135]
MSGTDTVNDFPCQITDQPDVGIYMSDGCRLSVRIWMPADASLHPVPAIVEHLPYRKRDGTIARDELMHPWFASHGYACLRIDMRGSGDSGGFMEDEYTDQEWQDASEVIAWASSQSWCTGRVGMMGISWGGFNGLQLAAMRPPALQAVITLCSSVDRFADDIHYKGGCLLGENIGWAANMLSYSSRPPDKALVGEDWRAMWMARLEQLPLMASTWHGHQSRDAYWQRGSVCEDYTAIQAAVLTVGGWHDGYRNTVSHLLGKLTSPVKGIVGPWIHKYPHYAAPQPAIGFLQEAKRWWDQWLKDEDTGVKNEPDYRVWLMDSIAPARWLPERPGRWIAESDWPSSSIQSQLFNLGHDLTVTDAPATGTLHQNVPGSQANADGCFLATITSPQDCGQAAGEYFPFAFGPELPDEQSVDDQGSMIFDGEILSTALDIVGAPELNLFASVDQPFGMICVRLCDLRPDGSSALITLGLMNLVHADRPEHPLAPVPGELTMYKVVLDQIAYRIPAGHRLRIALSTSYWPFVWPQPGVFELTVSSGALSLPVRPEQTDNVSFEPPETSPAWAVDVIRKACSTRATLKDEKSGIVTTRISNDFGENRDQAHGLLSGSETHEIWSIHPDDPLSANVSITWSQTGGRDEWQWATDVEVHMHCDAKAFYVSAVLIATESGTQVFRREYKDTIAREFV